MSDFPEGKDFLKNEFRNIAGVPEVPIEGTLSGMVFRSGKIWRGNASDVVQLGLDNMDVRCTLLMYERRLVDREMDPRAVRSGLKHILIGPALYGVSIILCFVSVWISLIIYVIVPLIYILPGRIDRHWQREPATG